MEIFPWFPFRNKCVLCSHQMSWDFQVLRYNLPWFMVHHQRIFLLDNYPPVSSWHAGKSHNEFDDFSISQPCLMTEMPIPTTPKRTFPRTKCNLVKSYSTSDKFFCGSIFWASCHMDLCKCIVHDGKCWNHLKTMQLCHLCIGFPSEITAQKCRCPAIASGKHTKN